MNKQPFIFLGIIILFIIVFLSYLYYNKSIPKDSVTDINNIVNNSTALYCSNATYNKTTNGWYCNIDDITLDGQVKQ